MENEGCCQAQAEPRRYRIRREVREWLRRAFQGTFGYVYRRFIYRHHMRLIHRRGWHWFSIVPKFPDPEMKQHLWCQWCGERRALLRR